MIRFGKTGMRGANGSARTDRLHLDTGIRETCAKPLEIALHHSWRL